VGELIFDKYEVQNRLAVGGMGEVFYAVQLQKGVRGFERPVILKSLLPDLAQQEGFIDQFLDEARVAATLNHPNVVSIYEVGLWNGVYFIAMEYIRGRNLSQLLKLSLKQALPVPPAVTAQIIHDAALGLDHAHHAADSQGNALSIVHRDISPQNIMVRDDGVTKVVDFGIARASNRSTRTATGAVKGKLAYMAPEQLLSRPVDGATDQFALGVVLWEMCCQRRLFTAERDIELIKKVLEEPILHPSKVVPGFPEDLGDIAMKMLSREVSQRFNSCADAAMELQGFISKNSPPTSDSPVASFMRTLGTEDLKTAQRVTPSAQNFVISLARSADGRPVASVTPSGLEEEVIDLKSEVMPTAATSDLRLSKSGRQKRSGLAIALGSFLLAAAGGGAAWVLSAASEVPVPPAPPTAGAGGGPQTPASNPSPTPVAVSPPMPEPAPAPGTLALATNPPGAAVRFDGRPVGASPVTLEGTGKHFVSIEKPGFRRLDQEVQLEAGKAGSLELKLEKLAGRPPSPTPIIKPPTPAPAPTGPGFLSLATEPWTKVSLSGEPLGSTPLFKKSLPAGRHTLLLVNEGANIRQSRVVDIKPGEVTKLNLSLR
jgi:serine/threonine protein kinase